MSHPNTRGSLDQVGLPELLASICAPQETGVLTLNRHGVTKSIYIQDGRIVFATSNDPDDRLGEVLLCKGMLHIRDFEEASARLSPRKRLGAVLVEMGHLKAEELVRAVVEQVKDIVFDLFMWFDGGYSFAPGDLPSREVITLKLSTPEVILGGILRIDRWSRVLRGLGGLDTIFRAAAGRERMLQQMQLRQAHSQVLQALDKPQSVRDLCRRGLMADFDLCRVLWAFRVIGLVEAAPAGARRASIVTAPPRSPAPAAPPRASAPTSPARPAAPPGRPAPAAAAPPAAAEPDLLEVALAEEPSDPAAHAMTMALPAISAVGAGVGGGAGAEEGLEIVEEGSQEDVLEIVETGEAPPAAAARPAGAPRGAETLDEAQVDAALAAFNDRHSRLYTLLMATGGAKVSEIVRRAVAAMERDLPGLFNGLAPSQDGTFDAEALKMNILAYGVFAYASGLDILIERELDLAASLLGDDVRRQIASELKTAPV